MEWIICILICIFTGLVVFLIKIIQKYKNEIRFQKESLRVLERNEQELYKHCERMEEFYQRLLEEFEIKEEKCEIKIKNLGIILCTKKYVSNKKEKFGCFLVPARCLEIYSKYE